MNPYHPIIAFPSSHLRSFIHHYEWIEVGEDSSDIPLVTHASFSSGLMFLFRNGKLTAKQTCRQTDIRLTRCNLITPAQHHGLLKGIQGTTIFRVIFQPGALYAIYRIPMHTLRNQIINIEQSLDSCISALFRQMSARIQLLHCRCVFEDYLLSKVMSSSKPTLFRQIKSVISNNQIPLQATILAEHLATSRRHLNRKMSCELGFSAKEFLQTNRFCHLLQYLDRHSQLALTSICLHFNYFDQAHFIRDFKKRMGCTPRQYRSIFDHLAELKDLETFSVGWKILNSRKSHTHIFEV